MTFFHDFYTFQFWSLDLVRLGFAGFYAAIKTDYLPGYLYILMLVGKVFYWFLNHGILLDMQLTYKLPSIVSDLGNSWLIYLLAKKFLTPKQSFWTFVFSIFNLSLIANSTLWGQVDSPVSFFILLSVYLLLERKYFFSAVALGLAQSIKPVAVIVLPCYLLWLFASQVPWRTVISSAVVFLLTFISAFIPFYSTGNFLGFIWDRLMITTNYNPAISLSAYNLWGFITVVMSPDWNYIADDVTFLFMSMKNWGYFICALGFAYLLRKFWNILTTSSKNYQVFWLIFTLNLSYLIFFAFFTRLHERHLYYSLTFLSILIFYFRTWWQKLLIGMPFLVYALNLYYSYSLAFAPSRLLPPFVHYFLPVLLLLSVGYYMYYLHVQPEKNS